MEKCLRSTTAFKNKYCSNDKIKSAIFATALSSLSVGGILGCAAIYAIITTPSCIGFSRAQSNAENAIIFILPFAISIGLAIFTLLYSKLKQIKRKFSGKAADINELASCVGKFIFLPMFAKINELLSIHPNYKIEANKIAIKKISEWGYTDEFIEILIKENFDKKSPQILSTEFESILKDIEKLDNKDFYKDTTCSKAELPTKAIASIAKSIANSILKNNNFKSKQKSY